MSFLIIGGLLAFGVLALVVAVFLGMGGQPQQATVGTPLMASASTPVPPVMGEPVVGAPPTIPLSAFPTSSLADQDSRQGSTYAPPALGHGTSGTGLYFSGSGETKSSSLPPPPLEGQLHEIVAELRTLHQESREIEHRLRTLQALAEHIEQSYRGHAGSFEDFPTQHDR